MRPEEVAGRYELLSGPGDIAVRIRAQRTDKRLNDRGELGGAAAIRNCIVAIETVRQRWP